MLEEFPCVVPTLPVEGTLAFGSVVVKFVMVVESAVKAPLEFVLTIKLVVWNVATEPRVLETPLGEMVDVEVGPGQQT